MPNRIRGYFPAWSARVRWMPMAYRQEKWSHILMWQIKREIRCALWCRAFLPWHLRRIITGIRHRQNLSMSCLLNQITLMPFYQGMDLWHFLLRVIPCWTITGSHGGMLQNTGGMPRIARIRTVLFHRILFLFSGNTRMKNRMPLLFCGCWNCPVWYCCCFLSIWFPGRYSIRKKTRSQSCAAGGWPGDRFCGSIFCRRGCWQLLVSCALCRQGFSCAGQWQVQMDFSLSPVRICHYTGSMNRCFFIWRRQVWSLYFLWRVRYGNAQISR